jgi:non-specific serine/threonine protein kinase/serine/threonine-protein kinase
MDHPNVARVIDAGSSPEGRPFFVMEHVPGLAITEYCDRHRLSPPERLRLFMQVCRAVQHAHQKGIIHRDIKPSNVLVGIEDDQPVPKIIDFGVAKATEQRLTDRTLYTEQGQMVGTPEYMSPEQAEMSSLDVDTRTDIYALGVLLYELMVGHLPFEPRTLRSAALLEIQRIIREQDPPRPSMRLSRLGGAGTQVAEQRRVEHSALRRLLEGDLDWIVMKALEKDRTRRYATASEFEEDLRRYLANEPVVARPPSTLYRMRKFVRRHRVACAVTASAMAALLVFGVTSSSLYRSAEQARDEAEAVTDFLTEMLASVDPSAQGRDVTVRTVLDAAESRIGERFDEQPVVESRLRATIGQTYGALGEFDKARPHLERAVELERTKRRPNMHVVVSLANLVADMGDRDRAKALYEEILEFHKQQGEDETSLDVLVTRSNLALLYDQDGDHDEAERMLKQVLAAQEKFFGREHPNTLSTADNLAGVYIAKAKYDQAEDLHAMVMERSRDALGLDHPKTIVAMTNLARVYTMQQRFDDAETLHLEALNAALRVWGNDHPKTLISKNNLALIYRGQERYLEAVTLFKEVLEARRRLLGHEHEKTLITLNNLGDMYTLMGDLTAARPLLERAATAARRVMPQGHPFTGVALMRYGLCLTGLQDYEQARVVLEESYAILNDRLGPSHERTLLTVQSMVRLCETAGWAEQRAIWLARL